MQNEVNVGYVTIRDHRLTHNSMGGSRGGGGAGRGSRPPLENHKLLYVSSEILVQAPSRSSWTTRVQLLLEGGPYSPLWNMLMTKKVFTTHRIRTWTPRGRGKGTQINQHDTRTSKHIRSKATGPHCKVRKPVKYNI